jgi:type III pantothenate kinase
MKDCVTLTVDVGNSQTVVGIFRSGEVVEHWRLTTRTATTSDEVFIRLNGLMSRASSVQPEEITHVGLSSVVPILERPWINAMNYLIKKEVQVVSHQNCLDLPIDYDNPSLLGADRICNALALREEGVKDGFVVDLGTASTFEILKEGRFIGGIILPGISSGLETLTDKAARLMPVSLHWPDKVAATNTDDAIRAGLLHGFTGQLQYLIKAMREETGLHNAPVVSTGGWSNILNERIVEIDRFDPYLTLKGIRLVALKGNGKLV